VFVGMDFGTTNSGMSVYDGDRLTLIPLDPTNRNPHVARTALYITNDSYVHIGRGATDTYYEQNLNRPSKFERVRVGEIELTFAELPTFIRDVYIDKDIYSPGRLFLSFKMGLSSPNYLGTIVGNHYFFLEDIIATYLYTAKQRAEQHLNTPLDTLVLGRPVRFSDDPEHNEFAKERLIQAAFRAGWKRVYLQYEPIAAAYYYETTINTEQNILIFDFGGGTLDMSIVQVGGREKSRVIANSGIPIAGDIFDQHIVRAKYPKHFGEGTTYMAGRSELPLPAALYEAFSDWQTLLALQLANNMENLRSIEKTARQPHKIRAFQKLITGQFGLKIYDIAEQAKRQLSDKLSARLDIKADGINVIDRIKRSEFESLIRSDVRAVEARLDELFQDADMQPADIDAVIRTGGSSQIPLFVAMLEQRFGADKVSDIDAFASVTSGLGVIAHRLETGDIQLPYYDVDTYTGHIDLHPDVTTRVPAIDLDTLKRIIDTQETSHPDSASATTFITRDNQQYLYATTYNDFEAIPLNSVELDETPFAYSLSAKSKIILLTSDYVSYIKSPLDIADLLKNDLHIELMEGFRKDAFSTERVQNIIQWDTLENADFLILTSTLGYTKKYIGERILPKLSLPTPYRFAKMRGYPAFFVGAKAEQDYLIVTHAGRASRTRVSDVSLRESRPITVPLKGKMIGAMSANADDEILIATRSGYAKRVSVGSIPTLTEMNTNGTKITQRGNPIYAKLFDPLKPLFALTNQRIVEIEPSYIPILDAHKTDHKLFNMKKSEALITLFDL
jgi:hypothetical chaperone protein